MYTIKAQIFDLYVVILLQKEQAYLNKTSCLYLLLLLLLL